MKNDYYFMLQDAILKNNESDEMEIYSNKVELMAGKENTVILNNLYATLDEQVTIDTSDKNYTLRTSNGCNINVEKTTFDGEKILLEGVGSPDTFENCRSKAIELTLSPSIRVTSDYMDIDYSYNYKGWNIKGHGIQYKNSSLEIVSNVLTFNGTEIDVGDLLFSMKGDLLGENSVSQDVCVSMISNQSKITETRFSSLSKHPKTI